MDVSTRWLADGPLVDEPSLSSAARRRRTSGLLPVFRYPQSRPGWASSRALGVTRSYAARAKLLLAVEFFPSVLPGTRGPGHAATASLIPSKPVAPEGFNLTSSSVPDNPQRVSDQLKTQYGNSLAYRPLPTMTSRNSFRRSSRRTWPGPPLETTSLRAVQSPDIPRSRTTP